MQEAHPGDPIAVQGGGGCTLGFLFKGMRTTLLALLLTASLSSACSGDDARPVEGTTDGSYVPCEGVTMTHPTGGTVEPDPDHPACPE